jgi:SEC-C motif domain protein
MRSRYSAYAVGDTDHLVRTWHPRTRPDEEALRSMPVLTWTGLDILDTRFGDAGDQTGEVEFRARYRAGGEERVLHERSHFVRRAGRWVYLDGDAV